MSRFGMSSFYREDLGQGITAKEKQCDKQKQKLDSARSTQGNISSSFSIREGF